jgi:hypothetical protein
MRAIVRRWTSEDDERLRVFVISARRIKRRQSVVQDRANKLGCPFQTLKASRQKWAGTPDNMWRDR